jgi:hypothetical protein
MHSLLLKHTAINVEDQTFHCPKQAEELILHPHCGAFLVSVTWQSGYKFKERMLFIPTN